MRRIFPSTTRCWKTTRMTMDDELTKTLKYLRLSGLMAHWDEYLAVAQKQRFSHVRLLRYVLEEEFKIRSENARKLLRSVADHSEQQVLKRYLSYDSLFIDEIGYVEAEPVQVGLFFTLMHKRHRRKPTLITSNLGFSEWRSFLKNDHLTAALIDRLTENSHVINMKHCVSLRPKLASES